VFSTLQVAFSQMGACHKGTPRWSKTYDFDNTTSLGMALDDKSGKVTTVDDGGQAAEFGIKNGWIIYEVGFARYSRSKFQKAVNNKQNKRLRICFNTLKRHDSGRTLGNIQDHGAPPSYQDSSAPPVYDNSVGSGPPGYTAQSAVAPTYTAQPAAAPSAPQVNDWAEDLKKLNKLKDQGVLTDEEFAESKAKIIQRM